MVHVLQEFEKNGAADHPVRCKAPVPRGQPEVPFVQRDRLNVFRQLMAMNVVPRLVLDDA